MKKGISQALKWCIVGILAILVADTWLLRPSLLGSFLSSHGSAEKAKITVTKATLKTLHNAVNAF